jgi:iron complex outermembrane recepter protein
LRGPQGTLRGRASPSGSMTVTTRRPDLSEAGGYVSASGNDIGGYNGQGAVGFPIIADKLAVRLAGAYDENEGTRVESINSSIDPSSDNTSGRATVLFEPTDSLSLVLTYQKTQQELKSFDQLESQQVLFPSAPVILGAPGSPAPRFIRAEDRLALESLPREIKQDFENINIQAQFAFAGQRLNYVGARNDQRFQSQERADFGDYWPSTYAPQLQSYGQFTDSSAKSYQHELRLSSEERIAGFLDYSTGLFFQEQESPTSLTQATALILGSPATLSAATPSAINRTPIRRDGATEERSAFLNLTAHAGDSLEFSGGVRYIEYETTGSLFINGVRNDLAEQAAEDDALIYTLSASYKFTEDFMVYVNTGTSWRPGANAVGDFSLRPTPLETSFVQLEPEESTSYEIGFKASGLDNRLRGSIAAYYQDFENYPYRSAGGVWFREVTALGATPATDVASLRQFNFIAGVPVEVYGVEADVTFVPVSSWDIGLVAAFSKGEIKEGLIPCNDFAPRDGTPDSSAGVPYGGSAAAFQAAVGDNIAACTATQRSSLAPQWSAALQSEFRMPITSAFDGYVRGLLSVYGNSKNDPTNPVDDYDGYELLNLYFGIRDPDGRWDVALYGKNITETEEVLTRTSSTVTTAYRVPLSATNVLSFNPPTNYYGGNATAGLTMTPPREIGLMMRYSFGSN